MQNKLKSLKTPNIFVTEINSESNNYIYEILTF